MRFTTIVECLKMEMDTVKVELAFESHGAFLGIRMSLNRSKTTSSILMYTLHPQLHISYYECNLSTDQGPRTKFDLKHTVGTMEYYVVATSAWFHHGNPLDSTWVDFKRRDIQDHV